MAVHVQREALQRGGDQHGATWLQGPHVPCRHVRREGVQVLQQGAGRQAQVGAPRAQVVLGPQPGAGGEGVQYLGVWVRDQAGGRAGG